MEKKNSAIEPCPICSARNACVIDYFGDYTICHCRVCDLVFSTPMKHPEPHFCNAFDVYDFSRSFPNQRAWHYDRLLARKDLPGPSLLDIGCGSGGFLYEASMRGFDVCGIDISEKSIEAVKKTFGLKDVHVGTLEEFDPQRKFDLITAFDLLEYLEKPARFLALVRTHLKDGGYAAIVVHNRDRLLDSLGSLDCPPYHLTRWTCNALRYALLQEGFEIVELSIKPIGLEDVANFLGQKLSLGITIAIARRASVGSSGFTKGIALFPLKLKKALCALVMMPITPFLRLLRTKGTYIYCLARLPRQKKHLQISQKHTLVHFNGKVSVIIPTYNRSRYLREALESVLAQTYKNLEIIVVDDGSTDDTRQVVEEYGTKVVYLYQENAGTSAARNKGISVATGDYFAFLDHDDVWKPIKIECQMRIMENKPDVGVVYSEVERIDMNGNPLKTRHYSRRFSGYVFPKLVVCNFVTLSTALVRRKCIEEAGLFDETILTCADWDMWLRISRTYRFHYVDAVLALIRVQANTLTANLRRFEREKFAVLNRIFSDLSLSEEVQRLKNRSYATAHRTLAGMYKNAGDMKEIILHLVKAFSYHPIVPFMRRYL